MTPQRESERAALVALLRTRPEKMSWADITAEVVEVGSAVQVWKRFVPATLLDEVEPDHPLLVAATDLRTWTTQGHELVTVLDPDYPVRLRGIHEAPPVLFMRGELVADDPAVSVVGSRAASERGLGIARAVAQSLVNEGITVVAGLALGIDTAAHDAALAAGGRTVAIIGTGISKVYPRQNAALHEKIAKRGLLLSQFWPDAPPQKFTFLMRNATMSGYGLATLVVEAGEQSGARAQARMAVGHGRPAILTDLVVDRNAWAKELVGRPGVHIAAGTEDVMGIVRELTSNLALNELRDLICA